MTIVFATIAAGAVAGLLGSLLGIGGGVFLVPFMNLAIGLPIRAAGAVSLMTVIATSSVTSAARGRLHLVNLRIGMVLEIFTTLGGFIGILFINHFSERAIERTFGAVIGFVAAVMASRLEKRNVLRDPGADTGALGGRYYDEDSGAEVAYRLRRRPVAFGASFAAGFVSTLGIGGGVLKVPALNAWCGIPLRVAAATSALMIGATAVVGSINYFVRGDVIPHLAAAAAIGVLLGARAGSAVAARSRAKALKLLMSAVLAAVSILYLIRGIS